MGDIITLPCGPWTLWFECGFELKRENVPELKLSGYSSAGKGSRPPRGESVGSFGPHIKFCDKAEINQLDWSVVTSLEPNWSVSALSQCTDNFSLLRPRGPLLLALVEEQNIFGVGHRL